MASKAARRVRERGVDAYLAIVSRRETREYAARPLTPESERRILDAGRVAGSSKNRQPWSFVVLRTDDAIERAATAVWEPSNVRGAAFAVAIVMHGGPGMDAGRAAQNMMLAAWADGIGSCPNGIADREVIRAVLGIGEDDRVATVLSFGYPARPRDLGRRSPEEWVARADRKPFDDVVREV
jgi:nitroreductase